jgi:hypothetical protein
MATYLFWDPLPCTVLLAGRKDKTAGGLVSSVRVAAGPGSVRTASGVYGYGRAVAVTTGTRNCRPQHLAAHDLGRPTSVEAASNPTSSPAEPLLRLDLNLGGDHHAEVQGKCRHANRRPSMPTHVLPVQLDNEIREPIDDTGRLAIARFGVDHPVHHQPRRHPVKITQGLFETSQHRQPGATGGRKDGPPPRVKLGANGSTAYHVPSLAVPLACHAQRSCPVVSGQPRTTPQRPQPAPFPAVASDDSARPGSAGRWSARTV